MNRYTDQYRQRQVLTATAGQLLLLAYDGALRFLREARGAMSSKNLSAQSEAIVKAQQLLFYLKHPLNPGPNPDLASRLEQIYGYLVDRLTWANVHDDLLALEQVMARLSELRAAWAEAEGQA